MNSCDFFITFLMFVPDELMINGNSFSIFSLCQLIVIIGFVVQLGGRGCTVDEGKTVVTNSNKQKIEYSGHAIDWPTHINLKAIKKKRTKK